MSNLDKELIIWIVITTVILLYFIPKAFKKRIETIKKKRDSAESWMLETMLLLGGILLAIGFVLIIVI